MAQKICCGGFELGEGLELDGRTLKATGGTGLPDPSTLTDGTAMVVANGEWKMQDGYGYIEQGEQTVITWDGDTEGKTVVEVEEGVNFVLVSDKTPSSIIGGTVEFSNGDSYNILSEDVMVSGEWGYITPLVTVIFEDGKTFAGVLFEHKGVYFSCDSESGGYISSLTYCGYTVHQFDPALIPSIGVEEFTVIFEQEVGTFVATADKSEDEINSAGYNKKIKGYLYQVDGGAKRLVSELNMVGDLYFSSLPLFNVDDNTFDVIQLLYTGENWDVTTYSYTITPAT